MDELVRYAMNTLSGLPHIEVEYSSLSGELRIWRHNHLFTHVGQVDGLFYTNTNGHGRTYNRTLESVKRTIRAFAAEVKESEAYKQKVLNGGQ